MYIFSIVHMLYITCLITVLVSTPKRRIHCNKEVDYPYKLPSFITSTSKCLSKKSTVFKYVFNFLRDNELLSNLQSGFMPGDSTSCQLTYLYDFIARALDEGKEVRAVFCDISKAFDKVWHRGIIHKLKMYGIQGELLRWFESYLENRVQRVAINGYKSDKKDY